MPPAQEVATSDPSEVGPSVPHPLPYLHPWHHNDVGMDGKVVGGAAVELSNLVS